MHYYLWPDLGDLVIGWSLVISFLVLSSLPFSRPLGSNPSKCCNIEVSMDHANICWRKRWWVPRWHELPYGMYCTLATRIMLYSLKDTIFQCVPSVAERLRDVSAVRFIAPSRHRAVDFLHVCPHWSIKHRLYWLLIPQDYRSGSSKLGIAFELDFVAFRPSGIRIAGMPIHPHHWGSTERLRESSSLLVWYDVGLCFVLKLYP